jgi:hypothetical protein
VASVPVRVLFRDGLPQCLSHTRLGLEWAVTSVLGSELRPSGNPRNPAEVEEWRFRLVLDGPLPDTPSVSGEFAATLLWDGPPGSRGPRWVLQPGTADGPG